MERSYDKLRITVLSSHEDLTLFSYEVLALVGSGGAGANDLLRMAKQGRFLAWAGESQYYVGPKRLGRIRAPPARDAPGERSRGATRVGADAAPIHSVQERGATPPSGDRSRRRRRGARGLRHAP